MFHVPEKFRVAFGRLRSKSDIGNNGAFFVRLKGKKIRDTVFQVIASDGESWEHVSVSLESRCPTWGEMCQIKDMFWDPEDCVVQYHPPASEYVNHHPYCLHLWRKIGSEFEVPPSYLVGPNEG